MPFSPIDGEFLKQGLVLNIICNNLKRFQQKRKIVSSIVFDRHFLNVVIILTARCQVYSAQNSPTPPSHRPTPFVATALRTAPRASNIAV